jgi:hypothetical protein
VYVYAELYVLCRKAPANNRNTTIADPPLSLDKPDW